MLVGYRQQLAWNLEIQRNDAEDGAGMGTGEASCSADVSCQVYPNGDSFCAVCVFRLFHDLPWSEL